MARARRDLNFHNQQKELIDSGQFVSAVVNHNVNAQVLIGYLARKDIPFKVINLGGGVKKIILEEKVCPECGGKGYCN